MLIKEIQPVNFFYFSVRTTLRDLYKYVRVMAKKLYKEAADNGIEVTGPVYWIYKGSDGRPDSLFTLEIALPVAEVMNEYTGEFLFYRSTALKVVSLLHLGSWSNLAESYNKVFDYIASQKMTYCGESRELYIHMDFNNEQANVTEIQVGVSL